VNANVDTCVSPPLISSAALCMFCFVFSLPFSTIKYIFINFFFALLGSVPIPDDSETDPQDAAVLSKSDPYVTFVTSDYTAQGPAGWAVANTSFVRTFLLCSFLIAAFLLTAFSCST
jgi:hypothetical protein